MDKKCMVLETMNDVKVLESKRGADGLMRLEGCFGVCGVRNNNGRVYETKNYARMVSEMQHRIETEGCPGELEHPNTMNITLENVSHKIESINIDENGKVTGTIVLLNTPKGQIAQSIVEGGLPLYISSRARGSVSKDGKVTLEELKTYDLVGTPGFSQARLDLAKGQQFESLNENLCVIYDEDKEQVNENIENNKDKNMENIKNIEESMDNKYATLESKYDELVNEFEMLKESYGLLIRTLNGSHSDQTLTRDDINECINDYVTERLAPAIQSWVIDEYSPALQGWVVEEFAPEVQNWIVEEYSPMVQGWVVEEFAPEIQNWVTEEYTPMIDNWIAEEFKPSLKNDLKENKQDKLDNIDSILTLLENRKDNPKQIVSENKVSEEDKIYESSFAVKNMPEEYRPKWNLASKLVKESIVSKSKLYDFNKEGVLESFWEKVEWEEPKAQINENANSKTISFGGEDWMRQQLRQTGIRLGLRK